MEPIGRENEKSYDLGAWAIFFVQHIKEFGFSGRNLRAFFKYIYLTQW